MIKVNNIEIQWKYSRELNIYKCILFRRGTTLAPIGGGTAFKSKNDTFNKNIGRIISLKKAIKYAQKVGFLTDKEERKQIWEAYRTMTKKPRWGN